MVGLELQGLRLNTYQQRVVDDLLDLLDRKVVGLLWVWKGNTGIVELYTYSPKDKLGREKNRRFHKFKSKDEFIGWCRAMSLLSQEQLQQNFL